MKFKVFIRTKKLFNPLLKTISEKNPLLKMIFFYVYKHNKIFFNSKKEIIIRDYLHERE